MVERECDCEPTHYKDGSLGHKQWCAAYPWCPHEVVWYSCLMPCGCGCGNCQELMKANRSGRSD